MSEIAEVIQIAEERFNAVAPAHMKYDAEKGFAIQLLKNNHYLMEAAQDTPSSLQQAITNVAAIGLSLNPAEKLAYLINRNVKVKLPDGREKWEKRVYLEPSYMGLIRLATDSGSIKWCKAECVHENDEYANNGPGEKPTHKYNAFKDRGAFVGVYCTAKTIDGDYLTAEMSLEQLNNIRDRSESWKRSQSGPWKTDFYEMAKKSVIRNAFKTWPRTDERRMAMMAAAVDISNQNEGFEPILTEPKLHEASAAQKEFFDQLIERSDALGMYFFVRSLQGQSESIMTNLYHSFPKGKKGQYQKVVDGLTAKGQSLFSDMLLAIRESLGNDDDAGVIENIEGLSDTELEMVKESLNNEELMAFNDVLRGASNGQ